MTPDLLKRGIYVTLYFCTSIVATYLNSVAVERCNGLYDIIIYSVHSPLTLSLAQQVGIFSVILLILFCKKSK